MLEKYGINLWDIVNTITAYIDWIVFFTVLSTVGIRNVSNKKYLFRVTLITLSMGIINISNIFPNTKIILCIITGVLFYKLSYEDSIYKAVMINLLFWLGLMIIEVLSSGIVILINNLDSIQPILDGNLFRFEAIFISKLLLFIELIIIKYFKLSLEFKPKDMLLV